MLIKVAKEFTTAPSYFGKYYVLLTSREAKKLFNLDYLKNDRFEIFSYGDYASTQIVQNEITIWLLGKVLEQKELNRYIESVYESKDD